MYSGICFFIQAFKVIIIGVLVEKIHRILDIGSSEN